MTKEIISASIDKGVLSTARQLSGSRKPKQSLSAYIETALENHNTLTQQSGEQITKAPERVDDLAK